jgi:hypothetical protein
MQTSTDIVWTFTSNGSKSSFINIHYIWYPHYISLGGQHSDKIMFHMQLSILGGRAEVFLRMTDHKTGLRSAAVLSARQAQCKENLILTLSHLMLDSVQFLLKSCSDQCKTKFDTEKIKLNTLGPKNYMDLKVLLNKVNYNVHTKSHTRQI